VCVCDKQIAYTGPEMQSVILGVRNLFASEERKSSVQKQNTNNSRSVLFQLLFFSYSYSFSYYNS